MTTTVHIIIGFFLLIIQTAVLPQFPAWIGQPDLLFLFIIFLASRLDTFQGAAITLLLGLVMDIFSGIYPGLYPTIYLAVFICVRFLSRHLIINETTHQAPVAAACYLLANSAVYLFIKTQTSAGTNLWSWRTMLLQVFIIAVLALPSYLTISLLHDRLTDRKSTSLFFRRSRSGNRFVS